MKLVIRLMLVLLALLPAIVANGQNWTPIHHTTHPFMPAVAHHAKDNRAKLMKFNTLTNQLTAPATKGATKALEANQSLLNKAFNNAGNKLMNKPPHRLSADDFTGEKLLFWLAYEYNYDLDEIVLDDDYMMGGWNVTVTEESEGVLSVSDLSFGYPVTINVNYDAKTAEMEMGTLSTLHWSKTVGSTRYDTTQVVMIVNEDYVLYPNVNLTNISGTLNENGSLYFPGSFCYYILDYCKQTRNNDVTYDTIAMISNFFRETYLMTPNGKHDYIMQAWAEGENGENLGTIFMPDTNDVYMYQADDTTAVIWNMWGLGNRGLVMYIHEDSTMEFPSLQVAFTDDWSDYQELYPYINYNSEYYNYSVELDIEGDSVNLETANTNSKFGLVTPTEISWDASAVISYSYDIWGYLAVSAYYFPLLHNKLTFTDGSQWFENQEEPIDDGLYYRYFSNGNAIVIAGEIPYSGDIVIPETTEHEGRTYTVKYIDSNAFKNCTELTSVRIGNSVTTIGSNAFDGCTGLTSVTIGNSVISVGYNAFNDCSSLTRVNISDLETWCRINFLGRTTNPCFYAHHLFLNGVEIKDLVIPNSITSINPYAFVGCSGMTSLSIPNSVTSIGERAFCNCDSLSSIMIGEPTTIGDYAFAYCNGLKSIAIPNSVTSLGQGAFYGCKGLTSATISNSITTISYMAFFDCNELTDVYIPSSVTTIENTAFGRCFKMENVYITDLEAWCRINFLGRTANPCNHFGYQEEGANIILNGEMITDLVIPNSITSISDYAFLNCLSIKSVSFPNTVTSIGKEAFFGCNNLVDVTIGESVKTIGEYAFYYCDSLTNLLIPNAVTSIGYSAFYKCSSLISIDIPNSVKEIGSFAFSFCTNLTSVTLPDSITTISDHLFFPCISLTSITIPNLVTTIETQAFYNCQSLTSAIIGKSVTSISKEAFGGCVALTDVTCLAATPPTIEDETTIPSYVTSQATLYVPAASLELYRQAEYWRDFAHIEPIVQAGDVNGDGILNVTDVTLLINLLLNDCGQIIDNAAADVNGDGILNVTDVTLLINLLLNDCG